MRKKSQESDLLKNIERNRITEGNKKAYQRGLDSTLLVESMYGHDERLKTDYSSLADGTTFGSTFNRARSNGVQDSNSKWVKLGLDGEDEQPPVANLFYKQHSYKVRRSFSKQFIHIGFKFYTKIPTLKLFI